MGMIKIRVLYKGNIKICTKIKTKLEKNSTNLKVNLENVETNSRKQS